MKSRQEFVFGYRYQDFEKIASVVPKRVLQDLTNTDINDHLDSLDVDEIHLEALADIVIHFRPFVKKLKEEYASLLTKAGFQVDPQDVHNFVTGEDPSITATTPLGVRNLAPIEFDSFYEPHEFNDRIEDSVIGFRLSKSFEPIFLDWKNTQGGLQNFVLDEDFHSFAKLAKEFIVSHVPIFADAELILRNARY